jgi:hypothetical protein
LDALTDLEGIFFLADELWAVEINGEQSTVANGVWSSLEALFSNPWVGIIGSVASILAIPLAIYFYFGSVSQPDLVYYTNPIRTVVVKQGTSSRLTVSFEGHALNQDVTAVQIAIWNRGRQAIRKEAVLQPLIIKTNPKVAILEATIQKRSRDVAGLTLDNTSVAQGEVAVSWNILEQADGGVIQLVYASSPMVQIQCEAVIVGQPAIRELRYGGTLDSPAEQLRAETQRRRYQAIIVSVYLLVVVSVLLARIVLKNHFPGGDAVFSSLVGAVVAFGFAFLVAFIWNFFVRPIPTPPFGFQ